jgi:NHL repeat.
MGLGRFNNPLFVSAGAGGELYVSDVGSGVIQKFDPSGAYLGDLAVRGRLPGQTGTDATAVGPGGEVYAVQTNLGRVSRFSASGMFVAVFGGGVELSVYPGDTQLNALPFTQPGTLTTTIGVTSIGGYAGPIAFSAIECFGPLQGPPPKP